MMILKNIRTGFEFNIDDEAGAELLRTHKLEFELVKATKEALKAIEEKATPTDEQRLLGETPQNEMEEKYKDVELIEDEEKEEEKSQDEMKEKSKTKRTTNKKAMR